MPRTPARDVPRWKRGRQPQAVPVPVQLRGRDARALTRELALIRAQQAGGEGRKAGRNPAAAENDVLARSGAWRFRRHLPPFGWLAGLMACAGLHAAPHPLAWGLLASLVIPALMVAFTRHLPDFSRRFTACEAAATSLWLPFLAARGLRPCLAAVLLTWLPFAGAWVRRYRWRAAPPAPQKAAPASDIAVWDRLAAKRRWTGHLTDPEEIPSGRKWQIRLDGAETHIGQVIAEPRAIAAAYDRPQTEAYAEPDPSGIESRGTLTILRGGTLEEVREWDGEGFGQDGIVRLGRFADGQPVRIRGWVPRDGTRHGLIAGASGAGKSELLNLLVWLAITSSVPVVPVILDPQNGQSLPQWQDKVLYAAGTGECVRMVRALHAGMMDRSRRLASMTWEDDGHKVKGMEFFDARLTGLPVVMPITDEAPLLLSGDGNARLSAEMIRLEGEGGKLGRKTGLSKWLVAQVPSLGELGDQALRSMLIGGNVICLRTGDRVSAGMIGLQADPSALPKYFPSGEPTAGLGYVVSLDNRQAPFRSDIVPRRMRHQPVEVPALDDGFREAMDKAMGGVSPTAAFPSSPLPSPRGAQPEPDAEEESPDGRRCVDAVWQVLSDRGTEMTRGEVIQWVNELATTGWGRKKPFSIRAVGAALRDLVDGNAPSGCVVVKSPEGAYRAVIESPAP